jgi:hypothetical protein
MEVHAMTEKYASWLFKINALISWTWSIRAIVAPVGMTAPSPLGRARFHLHVLGDGVQHSRETGGDQVQLDREVHRRHFPHAGLLQRRCDSSPDGFDYPDKLGLDSIHPLLRPRKQAKSHA